MPIKRTAAVFCIMIVLICSVSRSQMKSKHEKAAVELLELMNMEHTLQQTVAISLEAQLKANPALRPYEDVMKKFLSKYMGWDYLKSRFVKIYMDEFTESDLRVMIAFYKTETGRKAIRKLPILMQKGSEMGQQAVKDHMAELQESIEKRQKELGN